MVVGFGLYIHVEPGRDDLTQMQELSPNLMTAGTMETG